MTGRPVVTAYCKGAGGRSHTLAKLLATPDGLHIHIPGAAVGHASGNRAVNRRGGPLTVPLLDEDGDAPMTYLAMCAHGVHAVHARNLADAAAKGITIVTLSPVLR